jgi:DNA-binding Lrp family transcriptional regulator
MAAVVEFPKGSRQERQKQAILEFLKDSHTYAEIAEQFGIHKQTAWRVVKELRDEGKVVETPFRSDKQANYIAIGGAAEDGTIMIVLPSGARSLGQWAMQYAPSLWPQTCSPLQDVSGALAHLWRYQVYKGDETKRHLAGSMTPTETKAELRKVHEWSKRLAVAIEQMLLAPIWTDDCDIIEVFGEKIQPAELIEAGQEFEQRRGR